LHAEDALPAEALGVYESADVDACTNISEREMAVYVHAESDSGGDRR
jgi:hypothetical protein